MCIIKCYKSRNSKKGQENRDAEENGVRKGSESQRAIEKREGEGKRIGYERYTEAKEVNRGEEEERNAVL